MVKGFKDKSGKFRPIGNSHNKVSSDLVFFKGEKFPRKTVEDDISDAVRKILQVPPTVVRRTNIHSVENFGKQINATIEIFDVISQDEVEKLKKKGIKTTFIASTKDKDVRLFTQINVPRLRRTLKSARPKVKVKNLFG